MLHWLTIVGHLLAMLDSLRPKSGDYEFRTDPMVNFIPFCVPTGLVVQKCPTHTHQITHVFFVSIPVVRVAGFSITSYGQVVICC